MKLPRIFIILLAVVITCAQANAISLQGLKASPIYGPNEHVHLSTTPLRIYTVVVTPYAALGFGQIIETNSAQQDTSSAGSDDHGGAFISSTRARADIQSATAGNTISVNYEEGINIQEQTFIDCRDAYVQVYYKEE